MCTCVTYIRTSCQALFSAEFKQDVSRGCAICVVWSGKQKNTIFSVDAILIVEGYKWPSNNSNSGLTAGACMRKWLCNHICMH